MDTELIGGRYRLDGELGSGGMGTVWRGFDELLARPVAVKEIRFPPHTSAREHAELTARAMTEARAAAALTHPAIVAVHDVTMHDNRPWIIMQLVPGRSLQQLVVEDGPLSPEEAAQVGLRLLDALQTAHAGGVTHRDVKPSNVLMPGGGASAMLTDFSIAKVVGYGTTNTGVPMGSAGYVAPERMLTGVSGFEGDLFGLGATLFFALEGTGPFYRPDAMVAILAAAIDPHPRPKQAGHLTDLLDALLIKDPRQRATLSQARAMLLAPSISAAPPAPSASAPQPLSPPASEPLTPAGPQPLAPPVAPESLSPLAEPQPLATPAPPPLMPAVPESQPMAPPAPQSAMPPAAPQPLVQPAVPESQPMAPPAPQPLMPPAVPESQPLAPASASSVQPLASPAVPAPQPLVLPASQPPLPAAPHAMTPPLGPQPTAPPVVPAPQPPAPASKPLAQPAPQTPVSGLSGVSEQVTARDLDAGSGAAAASPAGRGDDPSTVQVPPWNKIQRQAGYSRGQATVPGPPPGRKLAGDAPSPEPEPQAQKDEERRRPRRSLLVAGAGLVVAATIGGTAWVLRDKKSGQGTSSDIPSAKPTTPSNLDVLSGHRDEIWAVAWAPDSQRLASASSDFTVRLWTTTSATSTRVLTGHSGEVSAIEWSPDGKRLASGSADTTARIWDAQTGAATTTLPHDQAVRAVSWSPDGSRLATGCNDRKVRIWDAASGQLLRTLVAHTTAALAVAWSPDGKAVASVGDLGDQAGFLLGKVIAARVWDPATGTEIMTVSTGKKAAPGPARRPGAQTSVLLAGMGAARRGAASPATTSVAWSPDSALLATGNDASTTWLWDAKTGEQLRVLGGHTDIVNAVAFKPDEPLLVTASADQTILLWNPGSSTVLRTFSGHTAAVNALAFSPDGKRLVSASSDKTLRLWAAVA